MNNTFILIIILSFAISLGSCKNNSSVLKSENLIAYVESEAQKGGNGLVYGKIVIMDIETKQKYYLNDEESYVNNPLWLSYNKNLVYFSESEDITDNSYQFGFKLGVDIYLFDTKHQTNSILFPNLEKHNQKFYMMTHEIHATRNINSFIIPHIRKIYKIEKPKNEIEKIVELGSNYNISKIDLSPNDKFLMLNVSNSNYEEIKEKYELLFLDLENKNYKKIANTLYGGGWDIRSENYVFKERNKILNFNVGTNLIDTINIPVNYSREIKFDKNDNFIGLGNEIDDLRIPNQIFLYDVKKDNFKWLTNDKSFKENLKVLL